MHKHTQKKWVWCIGGGTLGPVSPLLAEAEYIREHAPHIGIVWCGSREAEKDFVGNSVNFFQLMPEWKFRREWSLRAIGKNICDPLNWFTQISKILLLKKKFSPCAILSAGGFLGVPFAWLSSLLRVPFYLHHQDMSRTLTSYLCTPWAKIITVNQPEQRAFFPYATVVNIPQPVRTVIVNATSATDEECCAYGLNPSFPLILVVGGGTGALTLNQWVATELYPALRARVTPYVVLHIAGMGKKVACADIPNYYTQIEFMPQATLASFMRRASLMISRAGWNALAEAGILKVPVIAFPLPDSPQELNAQFFRSRKAIIPTPEIGEGDTYIRSLLKDTSLLSRYGTTLHTYFPRGGQRAWFNIIKKTWR